MCNHKDEQQWIPYIKTRVLYNFLPMATKYFSFHQKLWETFHQKSILHTFAMILFTNSNIFIYPGSLGEKIVFMKCISETFEHRNMFSKYDLYLKCLNSGKYASWKWIVVARNSSKPKNRLSLSLVPVNLSST